MAKTNAIGLTIADYKGAPTTLCQGCGHNSIISQIISAVFEENLPPESVVKFSGIGCSSKAPTYMLGRSFGFNGLHGRMPSLATGALFGDLSLIGIGMSGDGDSAAIGMGQFKHIIRRNMPLVYIVANNGVYGLTKGQFSPTSDRGLKLKKQGVNPFEPVDICMEALASNATFVARSFAGDPKQVKTLIKAAMHHRGTAILDIISPCVSFNNQPNATHSYEWGKKHEVILHDMQFLPNAKEIMLEGEMEPGEVREVTLHDGSAIVLKRVDRDYDPTDRFAAIRALEEAKQKHILLTGLLYIEPDRPALPDLYDLPTDVPFNRMPQERLRPSPDTMQTVNDLMF